MGAHFASGCLCILPKMNRNASHVEIDLDSVEDGDAGHAAGAALAAAEFLASTRGAELPANSSSSSKTACSNNIDARSDPTFAERHARIEAGRKDWMTPVIHLYR